jgi:phenylalanyl-tRNA synthetase beta chain
MENPLSEEASLLRPALAPGMLTMLAHNLNRDVREVRLFEQGQVFTGTPTPDTAYIAKGHETPQLSLGLTSSSQQTTPLHSAADAPVFELRRYRIARLTLFASRRARGPHLHHDRNARVA